MRLFYCIWALPTWVMVNAMSPFLPKKHPWKGKWWTMLDWAYGRAPLSENLDTTMWLNLSLLATLLYNWRT